MLPQLATPDSAVLQWSCVGAAVGAWLKVGPCVSVGSGEGKGVGALEGGGVGPEEAEGLQVGAAVGWAVGAGDGKVVGEEEGSSVGGPEFEGLGLADGAALAAPISCRENRERAS
mmetsp:Transcript_11379/g.22628  ORF Transcript_11379/g.22628 Transcript_11379/m.22628 type:complete len:115 (-) Transcript_11379:794-1138(-)